MSSSGMPLATREPRKGGSNTGLSVATADRAGTWAGSTSAASLRLAGRPHPPARRPAEVGVEVPGPLPLDQRLHRAKPREGVLPVEDPALVNLPQVALDIAAGEGRPA